MNREEFLIESMSVGTTKKGDQFLNLTLRNIKKIQTAAKLWGYEEAKHASIFKVGTVVACDYTTNMYNGQEQYIIEGASTTKSDPSQFAKATQFDIEKMWGDLVGIVGGFTEPLTKAIAEDVLINAGEHMVSLYKKAPAARGMHNAWYGGLLDHTWCLCQMAGPIVEHYKKNFCPTLSKDKVFFGLIVHDLGKAIEYDCSTPDFKSTPVGVLTNHIVLGPAWIYHAAYNHKNILPPEEFRLELALLMHLVAAHHGQVDWGSPIVPATLEAVIVHNLDNLDAKAMNAIDLINGKAGPIHGFSEKNWQGRCYYQNGINAGVPGAKPVV